MSDDQAMTRTPSENVSLATIAREWTRLGCIGFGGPPTHIALLRRMCVDERHWWKPGSSKMASLPPTFCRSSLDSTRDLLCLAAARNGRRDRRRYRLHHPGLLLILLLSAVFLAAIHHSGFSARRPVPAPPCPRWR